MFEQQKGIEAMERLDFHDDKHVCEMANYLLHKYFRKDTLQEPAH